VDNFTHPTPARTVAIVGSHPATRELAPFDDPDVDIWVFNEAAGVGWAKRVTGVFQMHEPLIYRSKYNRSDPHHWEWLQQSHGFPVWMQDVDPDVPDSVRYPFEEIAFGLQCERFFTSSIVYGLALAAYMNYEQVLLYGIEMASNTEYGLQRDSFLYWKGLLDGRGVEVERHCGDDMFRSPLYGYDGLVMQDPSERKARLEETLAEAERLKDVRAAAFKKVSDTLDAGEDPAEATGALSIASEDYGKAAGALQIAGHYHRAVTTMLEESGQAYIDRNDLEGAAAKQKEKLEQFATEVHRTAGRIDYVLAVWRQTKDPRAVQEMAKLIQAHADTAYSFGVAAGVYEETHLMTIDLDRRIFAAGGAKAVDMLVNQPGEPRLTNLKSMESVKCQ